MKVSYLTETLAIPRHVVLSDFGNKELDFSINVLGNNADKFYMSEQTDTLDGNPVTVKTLTPVGGLAYTTPQNDLPAFAEEIKGLSREDLYDCVTQTSIDVDIELSATLNGKTATKTYYFTLVAADIDVEIIDYLIDDSSLLNVVTYEDVNDDVKIQKLLIRLKTHLILTRLNISLIQLSSRNQLPSQTLATESYKSKQQLIVMILVRLISMKLVRAQQLVII